MNAKEWVQAIAKYCYSKYTLVPGYPQWQTVSVINLFPQTAVTTPGASASVAGRQKRQVKVSLCISEREGIIQLALISIVAEGKSNLSKLADSYINSFRGLSWYSLYEYLYMKSAVRRNVNLYFFFTSSCPAAAEHQSLRSSLYNTDKTHRYLAETAQHNPPEPV